MKVRLTSRAAFAAIALCAAAAPAMADQWAEIQQRKELRCATFADVPPFAAPDPRTREMVGEVLAVMRSLVSDGMTMMCVTHEMGFARKVGSRVIFMDVGGKILEDCSKDEFFNHPENRQPRTKEFLNKILAH